MTSPDADRRGPSPVRLERSERPSPFAPGRGVVLARVAGDGLRDLGVRDGDEVVLHRQEAAEHGDLAAVIEGNGPATLYKVFPDAEGMRLSMGHPAFDRRAAPGVRVQGVVVAVRRVWCTEAGQLPPLCSPK